MRSDVLLPGGAAESLHPPDGKGKERPRAPEHLLTVSYFEAFFTALREARLAWQVVGQ